MKTVNIVKIKDIIEINPIIGNTTKKNIIKKIRRIEQIKLEHIGF